MREIEIPYSINGTPTTAELFNLSARCLCVGIKTIKNVRILRRSLDARSKDIIYRYRLQVVLDTDNDEVPFSLSEYKNVKNSEGVLIIGAGPAGLFAALKLLMLGYKPIIIERGKDIHKRKYDIASISRLGSVNQDSNYCFGEGGAGTFSDGKLYTRSNKRGDIREVLYQLVKFGADPSILIDSHPHIGSDNLPRIIENIRLCIEDCGGEYHFERRVMDIVPKNGGWEVKCSQNGDDGFIESFNAKNLILATGHSAADIYEIFDKNGWQIQSKGFALGVRVEHPQRLINSIQYHNSSQQSLPPAEYSLVEQVDGRGVFSFCMCPGGVLVPSSTDCESVVLNGMSNSLRNSKWANSGIVVSVEPSDIGSQDDAMKMFRFQRDVERCAYNKTRSIKAPAQRMTDFVKSDIHKGVLSQLQPSSYPPGVVPVSLFEVLPQFVADRLKKAFPLFDKKMKGFYTSEALLLGVESRTSSPIRIPRDPVTLQHISLKNLYPCGEGSGYAGGIVSSALDGINCASAIVR